MFDLSALPLPTALQPAPAMQAVMPEITAESAGVAASPAPTPGFGALLALQSAAPAPAIALPESGKILPDPATARLLPPSQIERKGLQRLPEEETEADAALPTEEPQQDMLVPDMAILSAIFAAPDRLPPANASVPDAVATTTSDQRALVAVPQASAAPANIPQATVALASTAQIELLPAARPGKQHASEVAVAGNIEASSELAAASASSAATRRRAPLQRMPTAPEAASPPTVATLATRSQQAQAVTHHERLGTETPEPEAVGLLVPVQPSPTEPQAPASSRTEPAPARVDFATLVDTLARAREEASPHAIHASVTHAEFGRVSLRFERDEDNGLSVAMSSADPGFARAVSAAADASPASNETAGQAPRQQSSADARTSQGEGQRHQPQDEQARQRPATNAAPRHASAEQASTGRDTRDIYA